MEAYSAHYSNPAVSYPFHQLIGSPYDRLKASIAEAHPAIAEHSVRVRILATSLGIACNLSGQDLTTLSIAAELHDIGKLSMPKALLDGSGPLSESERLIIKQHPKWGAKMVSAAFPNCPEIANCVLSHHERLDGSGYPHGLTAAQIPLTSRIVAIADAFTALTEDRPFRRACDPMGALKTMTEEERGQYDDTILSLLVRFV